MYYYPVNTRMLSKRDIKMGRLCTRGGGGGRGASKELSVGVWRSVLQGWRYSSRKHVIFLYVYTLSWFSWKPYPISDYNNQNHISFQNRKICNGRTNDFSESCLWIVLLLWKRHGKKTIHTSFIYS